VLVGETERSRLRGHVIVCGLKGVGLRTVEQLHLAGVPVVVVDDDQNLSLARVVQDWGVKHVSRSAHRGDGLLEAGLESADAVVCAADELETLETALRVREQRPDIRIAVQMANPLVGRALESVSGPGSVLDSATLAAPSFVEACVRRPAHNLDLGGTRFAVVSMEVDGSDRGEATTFRHRFGSLVPVAIIPSDGRAIAPCPGRDHPVAPGDRVAVLGTVDELEEAGIDSRTATGEIPRSIGIGARFGRRAGTIIRASNNALMLVVAGLLGLILVSAVTLRFIYQGPDGHTHLSFLESLYFTVETVATVGFGDFSFARQGAGIQVFGIALIVVGVTLVSTAFALFTNILVSRRIEQSLGRGQVPGMAGHVVVIGLGSIGINVVEGLVAEGRHVVVVERDERNRYLSRARALKVPVIVADATQSQTHTMANLAEASAVAVLTSADLTNIETGLAVRESLGDRWDDVPVVLRVFDRNLARMMEHNFGFRHVRSTSELAAPWFVGAALGLDVLGTFYVEQQPFLVGRVSIASGGGLEGLAMQDLSARTRVIALSRAADDGKLEHPPRRGTRFAAGDQAYLLGPYEELLRVLRRDQKRVGQEA
jgi:Trk K+ transport system NAD-binding subunit